MYMYFNARSLTNKITLLQNYVSISKPKIVAITETWASPNNPDGLYALPEYQLHRADRIDKRGGGVIVFIHESVTSSEVEFTLSNEFEFVCVKLRVSDKNFVGFLCIYRPPNISNTGDLNLTKLIDKF